MFSFTKKQRNTLDAAVKKEYGCNKKKFAYAKDCADDLEKPAKKKESSHSRTAKEYAKYGLPQATLSDISDWVTDKGEEVVKLLNMGDEDVITDTHTKAAISSFKDAFYAAQLYEGLDILDESVILPKGPAGMIRHLLEPDTTAYVIGGLALGFGYEDVYKLIQNMWQYLKDYYHGKNADVDSLRRYAARVRSHTNKRTKIMIKDLEYAIEKKQWIKVNRIQQELRKYGQSTGYMHEGVVEPLDELSTPTLISYASKAVRDAKVRAAAGQRLIPQALAGSRTAQLALDGVLDRLPARQIGRDRAIKILKKRGIIPEDAPANSAVAGGGHIAGLNGDPPGGKNRMRRIMLRRMKVMTTGEL